MIIDIHTHHPAPQPSSIICVSPDEFHPLPGQLYSVGIHPWHAEANEDMWTALEHIAGHPQIVAIGETGIDILKGAPLYKQLQMFRKHIEISERFRKPLILHDVKAHEIIIALRNELHPMQSWAVHGFRGKFSVAQMLLRAGFWISFGYRFNEETMQKMPSDRILAETDDVDIPIEKVINTLSACRRENLFDIIVTNTSNFLNYEADSKRSQLH